MVSYYNTSQTEKLKTQHNAWSKVSLYAKVVEQKKIFYHFLIQMFLFGSYFLDKSLLYTSIEPLWGLSWS